MQVPEALQHAAAAAPCTRPVAARYTSTSSGRSYVRIRKSPLLHSLRTHFSTWYWLPRRRSKILRYATRSPLALNMGTCTAQHSTGCKQGSVAELPVAAAVAMSHKTHCKMLRWHASGLPACLAVVAVFGPTKGSLRGLSEQDRYDASACSTASTWKFMLMGGRDQGLRSLVVDTMVTSARRLCSAAPVKRLIFHTCSGRVTRHAYAQGWGQPP